MVMKAQKLLQDSAFDPNAKSSIEAKIVDWLRGIIAKNLALNSKKLL